MTPAERDAIKQALETLVNKHGVATVLGCLADVCLDKSDHILEAWQDTGLSLSWQYVARVIDKASDAPSIRDLARFEGRQS